MVSLTLKNIVEAYLVERAEREGVVGQAVCGLHRRKFRYFCKEKDEVVCSVCVEKEHTGHTHSTLEETAGLMKVK